MSIRSLLLGLPLVFSFTIVQAVVANENIIEPPDVRLHRIQIAGISPLALELRLHLHVHNLSNQPLNVQSLRYTFRLNEVLIKQGEIVQSAYFPAQEIRSIVVPVSLSYSEANLLSVLDTLRSGAVANYQLIGAVDLLDFSEPLIFQVENTIILSDLLSFNHSPISEILS